MRSSYPKLVIKSRADLRKWLKTHHDSSGPIWLVTYKKGEGRPYVPYDDVVDEAICFGWVDSLPRTLDDERSMRLLSPRKPKSPWSKINKERARRLIAEKRMTEAGLAVIARAKRDGSWTSYDDVERLAVPDDLRKQLDKNRSAAHYFDAFPPSAKKAIIWWITSAKTVATRAARIQETVEKAADNIRANQWRQPKGPRRSP